ncbi:sensor histidine kinase [Brevibacillus sp. NPDC058079]|uniref:sensor histidine kinase n=1 Tax=Brevibacillus sp. NPDC058079 TaxID=3346330 RepID=UPI0036E1ED30
MKPMYISVMIVLVMILVTFNTAFYFVNRNVILAEHHNDLNSLLSNIAITIENNNRALSFYEKMLAEKLHAASIAIQHALPPHIKDVKNEDLVALREKLLVDQITLFAKDTSDFVGVKSTDPDQIGVHTKEFGENWNRMFSQLMEGHEVQLEENFGQALPGFWSGPLDTYSTRPGEVYKWGYYNDGSTDYIIDPFVNESRIEQFENEAGVNAVIREKRLQDPKIAEISVLNYNALMNETEKHPMEKEKDITVYHNRLLLNGSYSFKSDLDREFAQKAVSLQKPVHEVVEVNGKMLLRSYMPISLTIDGNFQNYQSIIIASSDYVSIQNELNDRMFEIMLYSIFCFGIGSSFILVLSRYLNRQGALMKSVQNMYVGNIERMFTAIKEHRHDFNHHIFTLQGLFSMKRYEEVDAYLKNLTKIQVTLNDMIHISIPAFSGLLQTKLAESVDKQIQFEHHFERFELVNLDIKKTTHIVRILGNILDNAFHAVQENDSDNRKVTMIGRVNDQIMRFKIYNNGPLIEPDHLLRIFEDGFTTKEKKGGSGIGLSSSKRIIESYKGKIDVTSNNEWTTFEIQIPLSQREIVHISS